MLEEVGPDLLRILLTNDGGIEAKGLDVLEKIAPDLRNDVWVVAPETSNGGASHSLTLAEPLRMRELDKRHYAVKATDLHHHGCPLPANRQTA
jgi:5'-nucleotidase